LFPDRSWRFTHLAVLLFQSPSRENLSAPFPIFLDQRPLKAARIRVTRISVELAAALDNWSLECRTRRKQGDTTWKDLLPAAALRKRIATIVITMFKAAWLSQNCRISSLDRASTHGDERPSLADNARRSRGLSSVSLHDGLTERLPPCCQFPTWRTNDFRKHGL